MVAIFQNLTAERVSEGNYLCCGYIPVGSVRRLNKYTSLYLNVDRVDGVYQPSVTIICHGKVILPRENNRFLFDLAMQAHMLVLVRGIKFNGLGHPERILIELYRPKSIEKYSYEACAAQCAGNRQEKQRPALRLVK